MDTQTQATQLFYLEFPVVGRGWSALNSVVNQVDGAKLVSVGRSGSRGFFAFVSIRDEQDEDRLAELIGTDPDAVWLPLKKGREILAGVQALATVEVNGDLLVLESRNPRDVLSAVDQALHLSERIDDIQLIDIRLNQAGEAGACAFLNVVVGVSLEEFRPAKSVVMTLIEDPHAEVRSYF
jgi:hypothetical protein